MESELDSFQADQRRAALMDLTSWDVAGALPEGTNVNMHLHSFFSYNSDGYSPSHLAWRARQEGLYAAGLCDFDVLDGLDEFLAAGLMLGLRATVNLETRAFLSEFAEMDINSPGEPGVAYVMGAGFVRTPADGTAQAQGLTGYRQRARERNLGLIERINPKLGQAAIDYEADVLPLTPGGVATERHIVRACIERAREVFGHPRETAAFWSAMMGREFEETVCLMADEANFDEVVRAFLAKRGGIGYVQPSVDTFPPLDDFFGWVRSCNAIPMLAWLDGESAGERDPVALLEYGRAKGAAALNIVPDRNWNYSDSEKRARKLERLRAVVDAADSMGLPINIGTEMNKPGLPFVDDLESGALAPFKTTFLRGARIMVGHSLLARYAGCSYLGARAGDEFGADTNARNKFFESVGALPALTAGQAAGLEAMGEDAACAWFYDHAGMEE